MSSSSIETKLATSDKEVFDVLSKLFDRTTIKTEAPATPEPKSSTIKVPETKASEYSFIDTVAALADVVDGLTGLPASPASLFVDLEGNNLSRHGTISILQIHVRSTGRTYLIDILTLGALAFSTPGSSHPEATLKSILESDKIPKVFFDVRNDSDALYSHYKISLSGIQDLQLMALATRGPGYRTYITGLAKCIEKDAPLSVEERMRLAAVKEKGAKLFMPERGGSYAVFDARPLSKDIAEYCVQDTTILPRLWSHYDAQLNENWKKRVLEMSKRRVKDSQSPSFQGKGQHMALAPVEWADISKRE